MEPNETPPKASDEGSKLPMQPSERTSEGSASTLPEEEAGALQEAILPSPGTTNRRPEAEQRKSISLQQELPCEVNNSTIQQPMRSVTPSLAYANPTSVGAMSAKEVCILPNNAIVPLRDILDGGLNLGDSHLTNHSTLPKRKQKHPRTPNEVDSFFTPPQNPTKTAIGVTLGDSYQNSVPKTTPRFSRENPQLNDIPQNPATKNSSGGSSIPSTRGREPHDFTIDDTTSNNLLGSFVEGLPGRVSFLTKQSASSKGVLEGGSSALNVSKRPKPVRPLVNAPSNVSSQSLNNMAKTMQIDHGSVGGSIQSHQKRIAKETKRRSLSDLSDFNPTELESPIPETVKDFVPKTWNISAEATSNEQQGGNNAKQWNSEKKRNSEVIVPFSNHDPASIIQTGTLGEGFHPTGPHQKANDNPNHEGWQYQSGCFGKGTTNWRKKI
uniref:NADPH--cytochrome P450 reductase n=1 Tax=Lygus hesperus TaxID=30085 RepID=A0A0A9WCI7_LYGHE